MRKVIFQMLVTLDGCYAGPNGEIDWHNVDTEFSEYSEEFLSSADVLLFGRKTYEIMVQFWPTPTAKEHHPKTAEYMNRLTKIVFSSTLTSSDWENTRVVNEGMEEEIIKLKQQDGKNMAVLGSSDLAVSLIPLNLIDEFRIIVNPIILGSGKKLFQGLDQQVKLEYISTRTFESGNVLICYKPYAD